MDKYGYGFGGIKTDPFMRLKKPTNNPEKNVSDMIVGLREEFEPAIDDAMNKKKEANTPLFPKETVASVLSRNNENNGIER